VINYRSTLFKLAKSVSKLFQLVPEIKP